METFFRIYIACWATACVTALVVFLRSPSRFRIGQRTYWQFLGEPWKLATFAVSGAIVTFVAPYTGDPTWDRFDGFFMSVFCYATAVGVLYEAAHRDGDYPITWAPNIAASSVIYLSAGLFWNLEWYEGRGVIFSFMREGWPSRPARSAPWRFVLPGLIFAAPVIAAVVVFVA